jgi:hypothetical protein
VSCPARFLKSGVDLIDFSGIRHRSTPRTFFEPPSPCVIHIDRCLAADGLRRSSYYSNARSRCYVELIAFVHRAASVDRSFAGSSIDQEARHGSEYCKDGQQRYRRWYIVVVMTFPRLYSSTRGDTQGWQDDPDRSLTDAGEIASPSLRHPPFLSYVSVVDIVIFNDLRLLWPLLMASWACVLFGVASRLPFVAVSIGGKQHVP